MFCDKGQNGKAIPKFQMYDEQKANVYGALTGEIKMAIT